ncbi:MAG: O-antigen ligase family protein, partial [Lentilitoribacter sp.]
FTMSSAALLGLIAGSGLMMYDWLSRRIGNFTWPLFIGGVTALYVVIELVSDSGFFNLLVRYASLNTVSAYNRVIIWEYGSQSVINHPIFGIGYADWERPSWMNWSTSSSIDHFWLILAMRFGLPASLLLIFATIAAVVSVAKKSVQLGQADARFQRGVAISLSVFALGAVSVSLWLNALVWFFMLLGTAASLGAQVIHSPKTRLSSARLAAIQPTAFGHSAAVSQGDRLKP